MKRSFLFISCDANSSTPYMHIYDGKTKQKLLQQGVTDVGVFTNTTNGVAFSPDGRLCAIAAYAYPYLYVYNTSDWSRVTLTGGIPNGAGMCVAFSPDGSLLAVGETSNILVIYETTTWSKKTISGGLPPAYVTAAAFSPDGATLAVTHGGGPYLTLYKTSDFSKKTTSMSVTRQGKTCAFSPDGSKLVVGIGGSPGFHVFNLSDETSINPAGASSMGDVYCVRYSPDGSLLAVSHYTSPGFSVYETATWTKKTVTNPPGGSHACGFSLDGSIIAVGSNSAPFMQYYDAATLTRVNITDGPAKYVTGCVFSPPIGGTISNEDTTPITDALNVPVQRKVFALDRSTLAVRGQTISGLDGRYELPILAAGQPLMVLFQADNDMENSVVVDWVQAE